MIYSVIFEKRKREGKETKETSFPEGKIYVLRKKLFFSNYYYYVI